MVVVEEDVDTTVAPEVTLAVVAAHLVGVGERHPGRVLVLLNTLAILVPIPGLALRRIDLLLHVVTAVPLVLQAHQLLLKTMKMAGPLGVVHQAQRESTPILLLRIGQ